MTSQTETIRYANLRFCEGFLAHSLDTLKKDARRLGYGIAYRVLDAQYFGVAQRRRRVFVVGFLGDWRCAAAVLFERESMHGNPPPSRKKGERATGYTSTSFGKYSTGCGTLRAEGGDIGGGSETLITKEVWPAEVAPTLDAHFGNKQGLEDQHVNQGCPLFVPTLHEKAGCITIKSPELADTVCYPIHDKATRHKGGGETRKNDGCGNGLGIGNNGSPSPTITTGDKHAVAVFDPNQITSPENRSQPKPEICHTIPASQIPPIAFNCHSSDIPETSATVTANGDAHSGFRDERGLVPVSYGFKHNQGAAAGNIGHEREIAPTLSTKEAAICFALSESGYSDVTMSLTASYGQGGCDLATKPLTQTGMKVRRLTPTECERLQGFPDNYTQIPWRGRPAEECPDGPRYKAMGNSMAVPVMRWIGHRIQEVESLIEELTQ